MKISSSALEQVAARAHGANVVSANWLVKELKGSRQAAAIIVDEFNAREFRSSGGGALLEIPIRYL